MAELGVRQLDRTEAVFADVEVALTRLDAGTYWSCEVCEAPIGVALEADPVTRRCAAHPVSEPAAASPEA